ncbi:MAG: hypothetical protein RIR00_2296 [Pseudomonadota bacterium]|jgi:anaerobic ribonucleoside-triphosphate reductase activating protein
MQLFLNKAHYPVTVLGPGRRIGIWFQGCSIHCPDCISRDTWAFERGQRMPVAALLAWCRQVGQPGFDGITLSGGEPFDQPKALLALLRGLQQWRQAAQLDFDLLCYSGYPLAHLQQKHAPLLRLLDALIPEPYVDAQPMNWLWRGSDNQPLVPLSPRGEARYAAFLAAPADQFGQRLQVSVQGQRVWYIGLPQRGDMARLEAECRERGLQFAATSWQPDPRT